MYSLEPSDLLSLRETLDRKPCSSPPGAFQSAVNCPSNSGELTSNVTKHSVLRIWLLHSNDFCLPWRENTRNSLHPWDTYVGNLCLRIPFSSPCIAILKSLTSKGKLISQVVRKSVVAQQAGSFRVTSHWAKLGSKISKSQHSNTSSNDLGWNIPQISFFIDCMIPHGSPTLANIYPISTVDLQDIECTFFHTFIIGTYWETAKGFPYHLCYQCDVVYWRVSPLNPHQKKNSLNPINFYQNPM